MVLEREVVFSTILLKREGNVKVVSVADAEKKYFKNFEFVEIFTPSNGWLRGGGIGGGGGLGFHRLS